jgi:hypothetical protein
VGQLTEETVKHIIALLVAIYLSSLFLLQLSFLLRTYELDSFFFIEAIILDTSSWFLIYIFLVDRL